MAEIKAMGHVVEARDGMLVIRSGVTPGETAHFVRHDAAPGDYVWIYDDGQVEVKGRLPRLPENVTEKTLPSSLDPDHS